MPRAWSDKDERQYEHIKESELEQGRSTKRAKSIAAATVNKQRSEEGRTKSSSSRKRGRSATSGKSKSAGATRNKNTGSGKSGGSRNATGRGKAGGRGARSSGSAISRKKTAGSRSRKRGA